MVELKEEIIYKQKSKKVVEKDKYPGKVRHGYYCKKCKCWHYDTGSFYKLHLCYAREKDKF